MSDTGKTKRAYGTPLRLAEYFTEHPGRDISIFELMAKFNLTKEQIQTAIPRITTIEVDVTRRGQLWRYETPEKREADSQVTVTAPVTPEVKTDNDSGEWFMMEYLGLNKEGNDIARDTEGKMYELREL